MDHPKFILSIKGLDTIFALIYTQTFVKNSHIHWDQGLQISYKISQSELPPSIPRNSVESDHGCTSRIYFDNAGDNVTLTLYNVTLTSQKPR